MQTSMLDLFAQAPVGEELDLTPARSLAVPRSPTPERVTPTLIPESRRAKYDVDSTPVGVVFICLSAMLLGWRPCHDYSAKIRVLDVCAGAGVWSMVMRLLMPNAEITAVEIRPECEEWLRQWCDHVVIGDVLDELPRLGAFDLIIGNPPFSMVDPVPELKRWAKDGKNRAAAFEAVVVEGLEHMAGYDALMGYYLPQGWPYRGADVCRLHRDYPPSRKLHVPLSVYHRGPGSTAAPVSYTLSVWSSPERPSVPTWMGQDLPILETSERQWAVLPGTEPYEFSPCSCETPELYYGQICRARGCKGSGVARVTR